MMLMPRGEAPLIASPYLPPYEKGKSIGRINYAELGIVQLGAVYRRGFCRTPAFSPVSA